MHQLVKFWQVPYDVNQSNEGDLNNFKYISDWAANAVTSERVII